jgi:multiple sugar transport system ATP-binding protein
MAGVKLSGVVKRYGKATVIDGHEVIVHGRSGDDLLVSKVDPHRAPRLGDTIELEVELDWLHVFDARTERRLGT